MRPFAMFVLVAVACPLNAQTPPPASQPAPPASQPAVVIGRYYGLLKNEFMKDKDGHITLLTPEMRETIAKVRQKARKDKEDIDKKIPELQKKAAADEKAAAAADEKARQARIEGDQKANSQLLRSRDRRGRVSRSGVQSAEKSYQTSVADAGRLEEEKTKQTSEAHSAKAEVARLRQQSAELAVVASPYSRNLPPRKYFADLPEDMQAQLRRVGITLDEFKGLLPGINYTEKTFLEAASKLDNKF